jgi:putative phosphoribosyl transferase
MFDDRTDAGRQVAQNLKRFADDPDAVVLGIPRGGVIVAADVARALRLPLSVVVAAKIGTPANPEYAIGAVTAEGDVIVNENAGFSPVVVQSQAGPAARKAVGLLAEYRRCAKPVDLKGRTAIIVDDGLATGLTAKAAIRSVRKQGATHVVLAVPVASASAVSAIRDLVDELVVVETPTGFSAVGQFYRDFGQTTDAQVEAVLSESSDGA